MDSGSGCICERVAEVVTANFYGGGTVQNGQSNWLVMEAEPVSSSTQATWSCTDQAVPLGRGYREDAGSWQVSGSDLPSAYRVNGTAPKDSFKCYKVKDLKDPAFAAVSGIHLVDQFDDATADAIKLQTVCVPVDKDGQGIADPATHQCCYKIKAPSLETAPSALVSGALQDSKVTIGKPATLCMPCTKTLLP